MFSAKKKPPTGASELLRAAVLDMCLYSPFQSNFWQARLLRDGVHPNTVRSGEWQTACGRSRRSGRPVRHRRPACTNRDALLRTVSAAFERGIMRLN